MSSPNEKEEGLRGFMSSTGIPVEWIRRLLESDTRTDTLITTLIDLTDATSTYHEPTITPAAGTNAPGQQPTISTIGSTIVAEFTIGSDRAYRLFKIPGNFVEDSAFHVHWTKRSTATGGPEADESGKACRWRITYTVFPGGLADLTVAPTGVLEVEDTYLDSGLLERIIYRTADVPAPGFVANYYVGICVEAVTPVGIAMTTEPTLISVDLTYTQFINKNQ